MKICYPFLIIILAFASCGPVNNNKRLPIMGNHDINGADTTYYTVGDFRLTNQDSVVVTPESYKGRIYVADFFFTSCPTICPVMKAQMLRVYEEIENTPNVMIVSHTIDPEHDNVQVLNEFGKNLGVSSDKWHFLTGEKDSIYALAYTYMIIADEDPDAPGGFAHSGAFLLIDPDRRVRGVYDGTEPKQVDLLIKDIAVLRKEYE